MPNRRANSRVLGSRSPGRSSLHRMASSTWVINCSRRETSPVRLSQSRIHLSFDVPQAGNGCRRGHPFASVNQEQRRKQQQNYAQHQQAALRPVCAAAPQHIPCRTGSEIVALRRQTAVGGAKKVGLCPVPAGMAADRPPRRTSNPNAHAEHKADSPGRKNSNPVFAVVAGVDESEDRRGHPCRLPEACAFSLSQLQQKARNQAEKDDAVHAPNAIALVLQRQVKAQCGLNPQSPPEVDAPGQRELQVAAEGAFFKKTDQKEASAPKSREAEDLRSRQRHRAKLKPATQGQSAHQHREPHKSRSQAAAEMTPAPRSVRL